MKCGGGALEGLYEGCFGEVQEFGEYVCGLERDDDIDYDKCIGFFQKKFDSMNYDFDYMYDWNLNFSRDLEDSKSSEKIHRDDHESVKLTLNKSNSISILTNF